MIISGIIPLRDGCVKACRACNHRQWTEQQSLQQKLDFLSKALEPWAGVIQPVRSLHDEERWGYRDKVKLSARCYGGRWEFGMEPRDEFIPIPRCPVQTPRVTATIEALKPHLPHFKVFPLRFYIQQGALVTLVVKARELGDTSWVTEELKAQLVAAGVRGLHVNLHPAAGRILFSEKGWHCLWGESLVQESRGLWHGPGGFGQLLPALHVQALDESVCYLSPGPGDAIVDLYSGIGASLQRWRLADAEAIGVEFDGEAVACALRNAAGADILRGPCAQRLPQVNAWLEGQTGRRLLAYVNPPRTGLEPAVLQWLHTASKPQRIAYLSCSAGTLRRDLEQLSTAGYAVDQLIPFDFFPQTHHVEVLAHLSR